uniref:RING-type E3 ubiquitin transferase n=1 Tax=Macrostomum lignano TaxID=282301 RepID=A0A1I8FQC9_9PLAT
CQSASAEAASRLDAAASSPAPESSAGPDWDWGRQDGGDGRPGRVLDIRGWENESGRSVANVRWDNGLSNVYRVRGRPQRQGRPEAAPGPGQLGLYYRDHLPVLGERLDSVGGGCPYRVGERVRVARSEAQLRVMQEATAVGTRKCPNWLCGHVHRITERGDVRVQFDSGQAQRWTLNPDALERVASLRADSLSECWTTRPSCEGPLGTQRLKRSGGHQRESHGTPGSLGAGRRLQQSAETAANNRMASHDIGAPLNVLVQKLIELTSSTDAGAASTSTAGGSSAGGSAASSSSLGACRSFLAEVSQGNLETVRQMLASRATTPVDGSINGKTGLMVACHQGHLEVVKLLLSHKASVSAIDEERDTPLHYAAFGNQPAAIKLLAAAGAPMDAQNNTGCTALHVAVNKQHKDCVQALLQLGASPTVRTATETPALHDAIGRASYDILNLLRGFEPLHQAALKGNAGAAAALLARFGPEDCGNRRKDDDGFASPTGRRLQRGDSQPARPDAIPAGCVPSQAWPSPASWADARPANTPTRTRTGRATSLRCAAALSCQSSACTRPDFSANCGAARLNSKAPMPAKLVLTAWMLRSLAPTWGPKLSLERADAGLAVSGVPGRLVQRHIRALRSPDQLRPLLSPRCASACAANSRYERKLRDQDLIPAVAAAAAAEAGTGGADSRTTYSKCKRNCSDCARKWLMKSGSICMDNPRTVAFLCGHQACTDCAQALVQCHMCRKPIQARIQLYK